VFNIYSYFYVKKEYLQNFNKSKKAKAILILLPTYFIFDSYIFIIFFKMAFCIFLFSLDIIFTVAICWQ